MKLNVKCSFCKELIPVKEFVSTRPDLSYTKGGDKFNINCMNCGSIQKTHVNDVKASENMRVIFIGILIGLLFTCVLWFFLGGIAVVSWAIPFLIWKTQTNAAHAFNVYYVLRD